MKIRISSCKKRTRKDDTILYDNSYGPLGWGKKLLMKGCLHNHEVKRRHLIILLVQKLGM